MNGTESLLNTASPNSCPKRLWVMLALSDDVDREADRTLPRGLAFHLGQCDSCRRLANEILSVSAILASLQATEVSPNVVKRATERTRAALANGANFTGRVTILPENRPHFEVDSQVASRLGRIAAAAAIVIVVGTIGLSIARKPIGHLDLLSGTDQTREQGIATNSDVDAPSRVEALNPKITGRSPAAGSHNGPDIEWVGPPTPHELCQDERFAESARTEKTNLVPAAFPLRVLSTDELDWLRGIDRSLPVGSNSQQADPQ